MQELDELDQEDQDELEYHEYLSNKEYFDSVAQGADWVGVFFTHPVKEMYTKQLLAQLHRLRSLEVSHMQGVRLDVNDGDPPSPFSEGALEMISHLIQETKDELKTREHVPNKLEARAIRQAKAREKRYR